jgi:hypothetical protein
MIMYFDFNTYFRMFRLAFREKNPAGRRSLFFLLLVVVPIVSTFHAVCFFLDGLFFPGLHKLEVQTPVFVVGHARSGTTLLHRLMARDGERFSYFMLYELFFPSLLQKKIIRFLAACDRRYFGARIETKLKAWEDRKFAATQDIHRMSLTAPEEDDFVLTFSCASGWWIVLLPYMGDLDFYHIDERPARSRRRLMNFYRECVKRQLYLNGSEKIHLSKNTIFPGRVESLIETFPDARIVVPVRNPYETIPSLLKLMQRSWELRKWEPEQMHQTFRILAEQSYHTYKYPLEVLARHPETKQAIVDYRELVTDPKGQVEEAYRQLGFPVSPEFEKVLHAEQERARTHETSHSYSLEEFGLQGDDIHAELAEFFDRFGWEDDSTRQATREGE